MPPHLEKHLLRIQAAGERMLRFSYALVMARSERRSHREIEQLRAKEIEARADLRELMDEACALGLAKAHPDGSYTLHLPDTVTPETRFSF